MELIIRVAGFSIVGVIMLTTMSVCGASIQTIQNLGRIAIIAIIMLTFIPQINLLFDTIKNVAELAHVSDVYLQVIMKVVGMAYITEFASNICLDAGESAIASKVQLAGKIGILMISLPIINALIDVIKQLL